MTVGGLGRSVLSRGVNWISAKHVRIPIIMPQAARWLPVASESLTSKAIGGLGCTHSI